MDASPRADATALLVVLALTVAALWPVLGHGFVNWDDPDALVRNPALDGPGAVRWAFTTTHMSHYQPLSWLAWAALRRVAGRGPAAHHAASLLLHVLNAALVYLLGRRLAALGGVRPELQRVASVLAALVFAVHPLRVEPVAWATGLPYLLALSFALLSVLAYQRHLCSPETARRWLGLSLLAFALSLLARAVAPGLPVILLGLDAVRGRLSASGRVRRAVLLEKLPFVLLALGATLAEGTARRFASLGQVGAGARLSDAAMAPLLYLARTAAPVRLSPLQPWALDPRTSLLALLASLTFLAMVSALAWRARQRRPELALAWLAWLILLGPALGLAPGGLQVTADRYTYFPGVAAGLAAGAVVARAGQGRRGRTITVGAAVLVAVLAVASWRQARVWGDPTRLWTPLVDTEGRGALPRNIERRVRARRRRNP